MNSYWVVAEYGFISEMAMTWQENIVDYRCKAYFKDVFIRNIKKSFRRKIRIERKKILHKWSPAEQEQNFTGLSFCLTLLTNRQTQMRFYRYDITVFYN